MRLLTLHSLTRCTVAEYPKMNKWLFAFLYIQSTSCGLIRLYKYSAEWDKELNELLDQSWHIARLETCTIVFGEREVWVANRFYGYGNDYGWRHKRQGKGDFRPSIKTMWRLESLRLYLVEKEAADAVVARLKGEF